MASDDEKWLRTGAMRESDFDDNSDEDKAKIQDKEGYTCDSDKDVEASNPIDNDKAKIQDSDEDKDDSCSVTTEWLDEHSCPNGHLGGQYGCDFCNSSFLDKSGTHNLNEFLKEQGWDEYDIRKHYKLTKIQDKDDYISGGSEISCVSDVEDSDSKQDPTISSSSSSSKSQSKQ